MNDVFSLPLEVPNTDDDPPPTSYGYPYNPYIEGVEEKIVVSPLYYLYDHLDERMFFTGVAIDRSTNERTAKADGWLWEYKLQELDGEPLIEDAVEPRFKSTQHERDQLSGFDFIARWWGWGPTNESRYYDSEFGMFLSVKERSPKEWSTTVLQVNEPRKRIGSMLASDFNAWSPYSYVMGNPIRLIDPDGRAPEDIIFRFKNSLNQYTPGVIIKSDILNYTFDVNTSLPGMTHDVVSNNPNSEPYVIEGLDNLISSDGKNMSQNIDAISFNLGIKGTRGVGFGTETNFTMMTGGSDNGKLGVYQQVNTRVGYEKIGGDFSVSLLGDGNPNGNSLNLSSFAGYETGIGVSLPFISGGHVQGYDKNPLKNPFSANLIYGGVTFGTGNLDGVLNYDHPEIGAHLGKSYLLGSIDSNEN